MWQIIRSVLPSLDIHPIFAYIYSVIEMRDSQMKTSSFALLRIKATLIGLTLGLLFLFLISLFQGLVSGVIVKYGVEILFIAIGVLLALTLGELLKCKNFCGITAAIFLVCVVSHGGDLNPYYYATMRVVQTILGVFSAWLFNNVFLPYEAKPQQETELERTKSKEDEESPADTNETGILELSEEINQT